MDFCAQAVPGKKAERLSLSSLGKRLNQQWRVFEDWQKLGCVATSCGGQWFVRLEDGETWKCGGCKLHFHKGCEQQPPPEDGVMGLRCASCVILKAQFVKEWQQQQPRQLPCLLPRASLCARARACGFAGVALRRWRYVARATAMGRLRRRR